MCKFYSGSVMCGGRFSHQFPSCRIGNRAENPLQKLTTTIGSKLKSA